MLDVDYNVVANLLATQHRAGKPIPLMTVVGPNEMSCETIKAASPLTKVVLRILHSGDGSLDMGVANYFQQFIEPFRPRWSADFHQPNNEVNLFSPDAISWWRGALRWAEGHGYKLACPTWATGNPPDLNIWGRPDILDLLRAVRDGGHLLSLHEYEMGQGNWTLGRFVNHVYPTLPTDLRNNMPMVGFTEYGIQGLRDTGAETVKALFKVWQSQLALYPWVVGAAVWTVGDGGPPAHFGAEDWRPDNWYNELDVLAEF